MSVTKVKETVRRLMTCRIHRWRGGTFTKMTGAIFYEGERDTDIPGHSFASGVTFAFSK